MVTKNTNGKKGYLRNNNRIKTGDMVRILLGKDRGKKGKVLAVYPQLQRAVVEGLNMIKKHVKPRRGNEKGQRVVIAAPIDISNLQLVCPKCKKGTRIGRRFEGEEKVRVCKKCDSVISDK